MPNDADSPKFKTTVGSVKWVPENSEIVWSIKSFPVSTLLGGEPPPHSRPHPPAPCARHSTAPWLLWVPPSLEMGHRARIPAWGSQEGGQRAEELARHRGEARAPWESGGWLWPRGPPSAFLLFVTPPVLSVRAAPLPPSPLSHSGSELSFPQGNRLP